jgi:hypothetical protein
VVSSLYGFTTIQPVAIIDGEIHVEIDTEFHTDIEIEIEFDFSTWKLNSI